MEDGVGQICKSTTGTKILEADFFFFFFCMCRPITTIHMHFTLLSASMFLNVCFPPTIHHGVHCICLYLCFFFSCRGLIYYFLVVQFWEQTDLESLHYISAQKNTIHVNAHKMLTERNYLRPAQSSQEHFYSIWK